MTVDYNIWWTGIGVFATSILLLLLLGVKVFQADLPLFFRQWQWRLQGRAYLGLARVFLHTIYHVICLNVLHCARTHVYRVCRCDVARGHGLWRSRVNLESIEARSIHSHLCLPGLLLVSAGASAGHHCRHLDKLLYTTEYEKPHAACMHLAVGICHKVSP